MPTTPARSGYPQPNVLADGVEPNRLSTQAGIGGQGPAAPPTRPRPAMTANRLAPSAPQRRPTIAAPGDTRFEARRRTPSLATIIVLGFLLVTLFRAIASMAGH